ncbi:DUF6236 family protein [Pseudonocardia nematodicida]|uniref:DUF6236 family protein n=1 Tax=Pseudonocardia nematodicida TaxID=1206997 RepID=A0ABV1KGB1_9PSEU
MTLYYPHAYFLTDAWLKTALLTHGHVARMRPTGYPEPERPVAAAVRRELPTFLTDLTPEPEDLDAAADGLRELLGSTPRVRSIWSTDARPWEYREWLFNHVRAPWVHEAPGATWIWTPGEARMNTGLREELLSARLAYCNERENPEWLAVHPALAEIYIALLTHSVAARNRFDAATDDPLAHRAFGDASANRMLDVLGIQLDTVDTFRPAVTARTDELQTFYMQISVEAALTPTGLDEVPVERIVEFRADHDAQLAAFRSHVASLRPTIEEIARIDGVQGATVHLRELYRTETRPRVEELRAALSGRRIDTALGMLSLKFEPATAAAAGLGLATAAAAAAAADHTGVGSLFVLPVSAALTVLPYLRRRRQERRDAVRDSPVSYLLSLRREMR